MDKSTCSFSLLRLSGQHEKLASTNNNNNNDSHISGIALNPQQKLILQKSLLRTSNDQKFSKKLMEKELSITLMNSPSRDDICVDDSRVLRPVEVISDTSSYHMSYSEDRQEEEVDCKLSKY